MKGLITGCLLPLIGAVAAIVGFHQFFLGAGKEMEAIWPASIAAGICSVAAVMFLMGVATTMRERRSLRSAIGGQLPQDGDWVILAGRMKALAPLTSPISGKQVVAYRYEMRRWGRARNAPRVRDYSGTALAASTIETSSGTFRILAVPMFDMPTSTVDEVDARRNAQAYVAATHFQQIESDREGSRASLEPAQTDERGAYRLDESGSKEPDLWACTLEEWVIEQNAPVCVFGRYSQERGGIVADPNWAKPMRVMLGGAETVEAQLGARIRNYLIGFTITAGIAVAAASAYVAHIQ